MIASTPMKEIRIPQNTRFRGFSFKKSTERIKRKIGWEEPIIGAFMLFVFGRARKKKEILIVMLKKAPKHISNSCFRVIFNFFKEIKGRKSKAAKKKRMNANVKGGILVSASLKIGEAAPHMILVIMSAKTGFISI